MVDWLHGTRLASAFCVRPVASNSEVIFLMSMSRLSRTRLEKSTTNAIKLGITFVIMKNDLKSRLAWARERAGLTQQQLAKEAKIAQSTIASWESGARRTGRKISVIARHLGVDPIWLSEGVGIPNSLASGYPAPRGIGGAEDRLPEQLQALVALGNISAREAALLQTFRVASEDAKEKIELFANTTSRLSAQIVDDQTKLRLPGIG